MAALDKEHTRLDFAVQLGTVRFLGTFLADMREVPAVVVHNMAAQLQIGSSSWSKYGERSQRRHKKMIRRLYGYEDFRQSPRTFSLVRHLYARAWLTQESNLILFDHTTAWLVRNKVLLPGATVLERWIARIVNRAHLRLWRRLGNLVHKRQRTRLQSLLIVDEEARFSRLELLRRPATRSPSPVIKYSIQRLEKIREVGVSGIDLSTIPVGHVNGVLNGVVPLAANTVQ